MEEIFEFYFPKRSWLNKKFSRAKHMRDVKNFPILFPRFYRYIVKAQLDWNIERKIVRMATEAAIIGHFQMVETYISFSAAFRLPRSSKAIACSRAIKISDYEFAPERPSAFGDCTPRYIAPLIYICEAPLKEAYLSIYSTVYVSAVYTLVRSIELYLVASLPCVLFS